MREAKASVEKKNAVKGAINNEQLHTIAANGSGQISKVSEQQVVKRMENAMCTRI